MKTTRTLLSLAIIATLPLNAMAGYSYNTINKPANVANNGTVTLANGGPFQTVDTQPADESHIATTAYVKGAYNDAIAAVNSVWDGNYQTQVMMEEGLGELYDQKQDKLITDSGDEVSATVYDGGGPILFMAIAAAENDIDTVDEMLLNIENEGASLSTTFAIANGFARMGGNLNNRIDTVQTSMQTALNNKRVEIYTTWNNDNAKTQVAFVNAPAQQ